MMEVDYKRSIVNLTNSLFKNYGVDVFHPSLEDLDEVLNKRYKHVFFLLTDGLGNAMLKDALNEDAFLRRHQFTTLSSVFPPTTVAATTSVLSGKTPYEHGHLGWFHYFKDKKLYYTVFLKEDYYTHRPIHSLTDRFEHDLFTDIIAKEISGLYTKVLFPYPVDKAGVKTFQAGLEECLEIAQRDEETLVYFYFIEPDSTAHKTGVKSVQTKAQIEMINTSLERFYEALPSDSLVILTADHGLIDVEPIGILNHPIMNTLSAKPSNEPRATVFHVKDEALFKTLFEKDFSMYFDLYTTEEFLKANYFGTGKRHPNIDLSLGHYLSVAKSSKYFDLSPEMVFKGHHAGSTDLEMMVPLIVLKKE